MSELTLICDDGIPSIQPSPSIVPDMQFSAIRIPLWKLRSKAMETLIITEDTIHAQGWPLRPRFGQPASVDQPRSIVG